MEPKTVKVASAALLSRATKPPMLIEDVIAQRGVHLWSAAPYTGKTFLALEAMRAVAELDPFLGHFKVAKAGNVLYMGNDSPDWDIAGQFDKLIGLPLPQDIDAAIAETSLGSYGFILDPDFHLSDYDSAKALVTAANHFSSVRDTNYETDEATHIRGTALIVIDTLRSVHGLEENDNSEMQHLMNLLRYVATHTGAAIVALHHFNKSHPGERDRVTLERIRGAVAIAGGVDSVLALVAKGASVAVRVLKHRVAPTRGDFMYNFVDKPDGSVVLSLSSDAGVVNPPVLEAVKRILAATPNAWVRTSIIEGVVSAEVQGMEGKKTANAVSHVLRQLEKAGDVVRIHGAARLATKGVS